jgi:hypothetical protein
MKRKDTKGLARPAAATKVDSQQKPSNTERQGASRGFGGRANARKTGGQRLAAHDDSLTFEWFGV